MTGAYYEINRMVKRNSLLWPNWKRWHIGVTSNPDMILEKNGNPKVWGCWKQGSYEEAFKVAYFFIERYPLHSNVEKDESSIYTYLFKK